MTTLENEFTSTVLSSVSDITRLHSDVDRLMPERDVTLTPQFVLASLDESWSPRVAVVLRGGAVAGVVFGKERKVGPFHTGLIYADGRLGHLAVSKPAEREGVLQAAIRAWFALPRVRGVRLTIAPSIPEAGAIERVRAALTLDLTQAPPARWEMHATLPLPSSYEVFLTSLGAQTRHNFRYYRRKFEAAGHRYIEQVSPYDLEDILRRLQNKSRIPFSIAKMQTAARRVLSTSNPWAAALRHANGEYLSVTAGWFEQGRAILLLQQNNDLEFGNASLSVVLRGYLIETLIAQGVPELLFWAGTAPPLSRYAPPMAAIRLHFDVRTPGWRLVRSMIGSTQPWLRRWISDELRWVAVPPPRARERREPSHE